MRKTRYHPEAEVEVIDAALYLERKRPGYGDKFLNEIDGAINELLEDPFIWSIRFGSYRKYTTRRFRYQIWYRATDSELYIFAVAHPSRKSGYWKKRV